VWVLQQVQERNSDDNTDAVQHFVDALILKAQFLMGLTPAQGEPKAEADLLLLLNDQGPAPAAVTSGGPRPSVLASFRFQTSLALPTPQPPSPHKPPRQTDETNTSPDDGGTSVSAVAADPRSRREGEGDRGGRKRARGLMGRLNSSGDGFSYPRRQAPLGKRKRDVPPTVASSSSSSSSDPRAHPFQSLLLSRSTSVDSLGSTISPLLLLLMLRFLFSAPPPRA
jgi:hypothetical protein